MNNNILNIKIEIPGLELLAQAVMKLAEINCTEKQTVAPSVEQTPVSPADTPAAEVPVPTTAGPAPVAAPPVTPPQPVPTAPVATAPVTPPQPVPTAAAPAPVAQPQPIPTTAVPVPYTCDALAVAASQLVNMGKQQRLVEILHGFHVNSLMELPVEKYAAFAGCLKMEGVKI